MLASRGAAPLGRVRIGNVDQFQDGAISAFDVNGEEVAVVRWRDRFFAFGSRCTHWNVALTEGYVNSANQVVCTYHDSAFDMLTGAPADGPAYDDLQVYAVEVEGNDVYVAI